MSSLQKGLSSRPSQAYGVAMAQYEDNDKLLIQTFPRSLTRAALTWFAKIITFQIKLWLDLAHLFGQ